MPEKRELEEALSLDQVKVYLLDIAGTTSPLSFVQDTLCDYAKDHVEAYLSAHYEDELCVTDIEELREQCEKDKEEEGCVSIESADKDKDDVICSVVASIRWLLANKRQVPALQRLELRMLEDAYASGDMKGELFADVHANLKRWVEEEERKVYVYSTASVDSQRLIFQHSSEGDLNPLISGYFTAEAGDKVRSESYTKITEEVNVKPEEILFLTDAAKEANAAKTAGLQVGVMVRPGNQDLDDQDLQVWDTYESFSDIAQDAGSSVKRGKVTEVTEVAEDVTDVAEVAEPEVEAQEETVTAE